MKIYTKTGDNGETSLFGGDRVKKNNQRIISYGTVDELNCAIGIIRSYDINAFLKEDLIVIQKQLFVLGSELATPNDKIVMKNGKYRLPEMITIENIKFLENKIDSMELLLDPMKHFILPGGGNLAEAHCQLSRAICRRAEREIITLNYMETIRIELIQYLNRLSDYLFVLARFILKQNNQNPIEWTP